MFSKDELTRYADVLIWALNTAKEGGIKKGDIITLPFKHKAIPLVEELYPKLIDLGVHVLPRMTLTSNMEKSFYETASDEQIEWNTPWVEKKCNGINGSINILGPESVTHLSGIDGSKLTKSALSFKPFRDIITKREEKGQYGWTLCLYPTAAPAKLAHLTLTEYADQIVKACYLNNEDPVGEWKRIYDESIEIKKWLNSLDVDFYTVKTDNMDLKVHPGEKRKWIGISGHNIPSFELFVSPDCRETSGTYYADQPAYKNGNYVEGIKLLFYKGKTVKIEAEKGEEFVRSQLMMDSGSNMIGEFSLTDKRFSKINKFMANTLFDENFGGDNGNCHIALGSSYSDTFDGDPSKLTKEIKKDLGFNDSSLHWDIVNTEKKVVKVKLKTGEVTTIYEDGMFKY